MSFSEKTLVNFTDELASAAPVPGGGGASALAGALGAALASMVSNLTSGKKKYAEYQEDINRILADAQDLRQTLLSQIDEDAKCFEPLSKAYGIPKDDPSRAKVMEDALQFACSAPLSIMKTAAKTIELHRELVEKGSRLVLSDVGVGVLCCRTALMGASLNIFINAGLMKDREYADNLRSEVQELLSKYTDMADLVYKQVLSDIQ